MSRFTNFFRNFFVTEKQTPQKFSLLECMMRGLPFLNLSVFVLNQRNQWEDYVHLKILVKKYSTSGRLVLC